MIRQPKSAVVTGAASGIGRAVVRELLNHGWSVAALDLDEEGLDKLAPNSRSKLLTRTTDVSSATDVDQAMSQARRDHGPLGAVIAAAGIWTPGTVKDLTDDEWERAIRVNLTGTFHVARAAMNQLSATGGGAFVAVASDAGLQGSQDCSAYVAAKHGVVGLVRSMALDFGAQGIRSNAICPGFVETAMTEQIFRDAPPELIKARRDEVPAGRFAKPAEVATVIRALVDPEFSFVNGAALPVDGGATAGYYTPKES